MSAYHVTPDLSDDWERVRESKAKIIDEMN